MVYKSLNANQLATQLDVNRSSVSRWVTGKDIPKKHSTIAKMAEFFDVPIQMVSDAIDGKYQPAMTKEERDAEQIKARYSPSSIHLAANAMHYSGKPEGFYRFPCLGEVTAGKLKMSEEQQDTPYYEWMDVKEYASDMFCLKVTGDSMEPKIPNGAVILVRPAKQFRNKGIYVVQTNYGESTLKILQFSQEGGTLLPLNKKYAPIPIQDFEIEKAFEVLEYKVSLV